MMIRPCKTKDSTRSALQGRLSAGCPLSARCLLVRGAPLASYGLVAHFPSYSPVVVVVVVVVVAHVFEQRLMA